ncbi:AraC family transcriptional regulator [Flavobacterium aquidurense]|uniref:helix-turn-helix domain-containing protein n=1 Tax=Flavobacterium aquidurense TaxID=362413 RepID=UPI002863C55D|nr:AraC family transcriptional regulator [Flavobacterium aquidurense]MDR7371729.1 AraC-like DNA-binding protein [Flavobacterium aquidurense]
MKKIIQHYGADLEWTKSLAKKLDGKIQGNFIKASEDIHTGIRYFKDCGSGIVAMYVDVTYNTDVHFTIKNNTNDYVGLHYYLSESDATLSFDTVSNTVGSWSYNLLLLDSSLQFEFEAKKGSKIFMCCIFIKKETMKIYAQKNNIFKKTIDQILNPQQNTIVQWERMSIKSYHALKDLQKLKEHDVLFDLHLTGTVHLLISDHLRKVSEKKCIIQLVNEDDLSSILSVQRYLLENINDHFPSIKALAQKSNMSVTKFKSLFKKITGDTPNSFFLENKLFKAKELLEEKQMTVTEVSEILSFNNSSYFANKFRGKFGLLPKTYSQQL